MDSANKPHAVFIPLPAQGHINPLLRLSKLLNSKGFHITFVHTEFNYERLMKSNNDQMKLANDFRFETVSDGLPPGNPRGVLDIPGLCLSMSTFGLESFRQLVARLNGSPDVPPVTCIVSDGAMSSTLKVAKEFGIPEILFFTPSACGMLAYFHFSELRERGYFPLNDESCLTNGYLDTKIDWIPAMEGIKLKDLPTFIRTTNDEDIMFNHNVQAVNNALETKAIILNTFDDLEKEVLDAIKQKIPSLYTIGSLTTLHDKFSEAKVVQDNNIGSSLWKEDKSCLEWLDNKQPGSVLYVNFGSLVIMSAEQLVEFAWGLANSKHPFVWVIRPNLINGNTELIRSWAEFSRAISGSGLILEWCPQEEVLKHPSVGGFLTHCGWNSTLESIAHGVPMLCWPFFAEQQTNCFFVCKKWGVGWRLMLM